MDAKTYLKSELDKHVTEAKAITDRATEEGRSLTEAERSSVDARVKSAAEVKARLVDMEANDELRDSIEKLGNSVTVSSAKGGEAPTMPAKSVGEAFVNSKAWKALKERGTGGSWSTGAIEIPFAGRKANETIITTNLDLVPAQYVPGVTDIAKQPNTIMAVLPSATTGSTRIRYIKETTATNLADAVLEQGQKPQSVLQFDNADVNLTKVATILYVSDEFVEDVDGMQSYLNGRLAAFVEFEEEDQVLNQTGGLFDLTTQTQPLGGDSVADAVYKAKTQCRTGSFLEPTHLIIHPTDWEGLRLAKDGNDQYLMGLGPWAGPGGSEPPVWGLNPIVTTRATVGTALVGTMNAGAVQLYRRGGVTVEASNSNASQFETNQITLRAESRLALVVYRPGAFCEVTGL